MRNIPVSIKTALDSALSAKDAVDLPFIYEVQAKYVEVFGQIESVNYDSSSLVCLIDDGTGRIHLKQYFGMSPAHFFSSSHRQSNQSGVKAKSRHSRS